MHQLSKHIRQYKSLAACSISEIPIYIPTFNNPTYTNLMINQLKMWQVQNIYIMDNASSSVEMHDFLNTVSMNVKVIRFEQNRGPHYLLEDENFSLMPEIFCITDPDIMFNESMPQDFLYTLLKQTHKHAIGKAGLALNIQAKEIMRSEKFVFGGDEYTIWDWEAQFWVNQISETDDENPVYRASIDTTFCLYNKKYFNRSKFYDAIRVAGSYTCKHLPWYKDNGLPRGEERVYKETQKFSYHMR